MTSPWPRNDDPAAGLMRPAAVLTAALCLLTGTVAWAHDSWFATLPTPRATEVRLALGTGARFPKLESSVGALALAAHGCRHGVAPPVPLRIQRDTMTALQLRAHPVSTRSLAAAHGAITCWAQLVPFEVEIPPAIVELYFKEIQPPEAVREAWREMLARGVTWKERYTKHVRIERYDPRLGSAAPPAATAVPMGLDIVRDGPLRPPTAGDVISFQVLRDGQPLADFALELQSDWTPIGIWLRTDAQGRARVRLARQGGYLLRGVDLRLSTTVPDAWESRFVMLGFEAAAAVATTTTAPR